MPTAEIKVARLPIALVIPNPDQPRKTFKPESIAEMAASILQDGVRQPIEVVPLSAEKVAYCQSRFGQCLEQDLVGDPFFEKAIAFLNAWDGQAQVHMIVFGERRWRGSIVAEQSDIPALISSGMTEVQVATVALLENMQREEVGFLEEARAIADWMQKIGLDPKIQKDRQAAAKRLGKSGTYVDWRLDTLFLEPEIQICADKGELSANEICHLAWCKTSEMQRKLFALIRSGKCKSHVQLEAATAALNSEADKQLVAQMSLFDAGTVDKSQAIALLKEIESVGQKLAKISANGESVQLAFAQTDAPDLAMMRDLLNGIEKTARSIAKNQVTFREQAMFAANL